MRSQLYNHIKNLLIPCLMFSMITGFLSAIIITVFKIAVEWVVKLSTTIYGAARANPVWIPLLVIAAAAIGLVASFILTISHSCRGGGIPTSIVAIRGVINFKWIISILVLPFSALLTFLCGIPLGTEGPCVQIGTAVGNGVVQCLGREKHKGWRRYIMTGGACAGFSIATASPIAAIIFSIEELHKHFSPLLLTVSSISVMTAQIAVQALTFFGIGSGRLFSIPVIPTISIGLLFVPLLIGFICGGCSIIFTRFYHLVDKLMRCVLKKLPIKIVFPILFACVCIVGLFLSDALGTGHDLSEKLFQVQIKWCLLILILLIRVVILMISNTVGVTGGVFLPTLAFGAIIGSLCADGMIALGWIESQHYILIVVLGITAFLGATSRIPITACVFAIEVLGGINNALAIIIATTVALLIVELSGLEDFTDTIIESKMNSIIKGKKPAVIEAALTVNQNSFVVGKELRDILWPNACVIVSFERAPGNYGKLGVAPGDVVTVHYETYNPAATSEEFRVLVGEQSEQINRIMNPYMDDAEN